MKTIKLKTKDLNDLANVMSGIMNEKSKELTFDEVLRLQKVVTSMKGGIKEYSEVLDAINKEKSEFVKTANAKISESRKEALNKLSGEETDKDFMKKLDEFAGAVFKDAQQEMIEEIAPKIEKLEEEFGNVVIEFDIEEKNLSILVDIFERFAKENYIRKDVMVEVYEALHI